MMFTQRCILNRDSTDVDKRQGLVDMDRSYEANDPGSRRTQI